MGLGIEEFTDDSDITFLVETWEHDTQRIQGLRNYNVHSLIWEKNPRQRRGQGGVACLIKKEIEKYVSIIKNDEHKCYMWLKIETPNDLPTFVVGCYIPHQDSNFYACLDKDQPFANLEDDIAYLKSKGEVKIDMASLQREYWAGWDSMASVGLWLYLAYERRVLFKRLYLHNSRVCTRE